MATFTTSSEVGAELPSGWSSYLTGGQVTTAITNASNRCLSGLVEYWQIHDVTDTPSTPYLVRKAATYYAAAELHALLDAVNISSAGLAAQYEARADAIMNPIADGSRTLPPVTKSAEALAFGTHDAEYPDDHKFTIAPRRVIPESVQIATYQYGVDYGVYYSVGHRAWMLRRYDGAITGGEGGSTVTYDFTYLRDREVATSNFKVTRFLAT